MRIEAALLARVSDDKSGRSTSVPEQVERGISAAKTLGWTVPRRFVFEDADISASRFAGGKERPGWQALRRVIEAGFVRGIIIWEIDRASREMSDWAGFLNLCRDRRILIHVITHSRTYDTTVPRDRRSLLEDGVDAEYYSEKLSASIRRNLDGARADGKPMAKIPRGYVKLRDPASGAITGVDIDPEIQAQVQDLFTMLDAGHAVRAVAEKLGWPTRTVRHCARNVGYLGKRKLKPDDPPSAWVACQWNPMVDEDLFFRVQDRLDSHQGAGQRPGAHRSLLAHLAACGACGGTVTTVNRKGEGCYRCIRGCVVIRDRDLADYRVGWQVVNWLLGPGVLERYTPGQRP